MSSIQNKIVGIIRSTIAAYDMETPAKWDFSNVGTLYVQKSGSLDTLFSIYMNFQSDHVSGGILFKGDRIINSWPHRMDKLLQNQILNSNYNDGTGIEDFLKRLKTTLESDIDAN